MKKIALFLCITMIYATSCSKDDNESSSSDKIIGTWVETKSIVRSDNSVYEEFEISEMEGKTTYYADGSTEAFTDFGSIDGLWVNLGGAYIR